MNPADELRELLIQAGMPGDKFYIDERTDALFGEVSLTINVAGSQVNTLVGILKKIKQGAQ